MSPDELKNHLYLLDLTPESRATILEMALTSPARKVGSGALDNSIVRFQSIKNASPRLLESHTVERLLALELELDPSVLAYYTQVRCTGIERRGGSHVASGTVDFMAVKKGSIGLIEAKPRSKIDQLLAQKPDEWQTHGDLIVRPPYLEWAHQRQMEYRVWTPPHPLAVYLSNLQLIYACQSVFPGDGENAVLSHAVQTIRRRPQTVEDLCNSIDRFTPELAALLIGRRLAYGPVRHILVEDIDRFTLFSDPEQVKVLDHDLLQRVTASIAQSDDPISRASYTDICRGRKRLAKVNAFIYEGNPPRYWKPLVGAVKQARLEGRNDLTECLTNYASSGNTSSRLSTDQLTILDSHVVSHWNSGVSIDASDFHGAVRDACKARGIRPPTLKTIAKHLLKKQNRKMRLLNTGGIRAYQARKNASDPRVRSMSAQARFLVLEIDSTKCDNRVMPDIAPILLFDAPTLYVGIDGCTTDVMASAFVFGPAKRDGLALLLRDFVRRHGRLPHIIKMDRGPDNKNKWIEGFCDRYNIILIHDPTACSRSKGDIENALGRANTSLAHKLLGSTAPDKAGRKVDGRFKSYRTARHQFITLRKEMEKVLFEDFARTPRGDGVSPEERTDLSTILFPSVGRLQVIDEEFLYQTSIPVGALMIDPLKGMRTCGQTFCSDEMLGLNEDGKAIEARRDCSDPSLIRVQLERGSVRAWSKLTATMAKADADDREFHSLYSAVIRGEARERREDIRHERRQRIDAANAAANKAWDAQSTPPKEDHPPQMPNLSVSASDLEKYREVRE